MPKAETPAVTPSQAHYILEKLIAERKVTAADVRRHIAGMWQEMSALEKRIAQLRDVAEPVRHPVRAARIVKEKLKRATRRMRRQVSAEVAASRQLQGRYIAAIRQLPKTRRARYAAIAKEKGREAAITAIQKDTRT
jgi:hypothetical protein